MAGQDTPRTGETASSRIAADLEAAITRGDYRPGQALPSLTALMHEHEVSRQTAQSAVDLLKSKGIVVGRSGAGVFVKERSTVTRLSRSRLRRAAREAGRGAFLADAEASRFTPSVEVAVRIEPADTRTAVALGIDEGAEVVTRERVMSADGVPVQLATSRLPAAIAAGTRLEQEDTGPTGSYGVLEELGHMLDRGVERVRTRMPSFAEAEKLRLGPGVPVIEVTRIAYDQTGRAVEVNVMVMAGDRYELEYDVELD